MISLYLKYVLISLFSFVFFRHLIKSSQMAVLCALLWTFSGYNVLWGQHYQFLTNMVFFTISMCALQLFLERDQKRFLLIPAIATLAYTNYFHLYMSCFMFGGYALSYLIIHQVKPKIIIKRLLFLFLSLVMAILIASEYMLPHLSAFFSSTRTSDVTGISSEYSLIYSPEYLLTFLSRLLTNNALGVGDDYTGSKNYYEAAILSVSVLFIFMLVFMVQTRWKKWIILITAILVVLLCLAPVSLLLGFSYEKQRWTYIYCFAEVVLIGIGIKCLFEKRKQSEIFQTLIRTVLISDIIYVAFLLILWIAQRKDIIILNTKSCCFVLLFLIMYSIFFLGFCYGKMRVQYAILSGIIVIELIVGNYATINDRSAVTTSEWYENMYYDKTKETVEWIHNQDSSIYRINKTYDSVFYNDQLVQRYAGTAVYSSINSSNLVSLFAGLGYTQLYNNSWNYIRISGEDLLSNTLLGVKYLIAKTEDDVNELYYERIYNDDEYIVYKAKYNLGFGYLYQNQISQATVEQASPSERLLSLTQAYYVTDADDEALSEDNQIFYMSDDMKKLEGFSFLAESDNVDIISSGESLVMEGTDDDMQLIFNIADIPEGWSVSSVSFTITAEGSSEVQLFYAGEEGSFTQEKSMTGNYEEGTSTFSFNLYGYDDVTALRIDPSMIRQNIVIESMEIELVRDDAIIENVKLLQENSMTDFSQTGNTFTGTINNTYEDGAMLCIPLVYSDHWVATVDGENIDVQNINGGLVGIELREGYHEIVITYVDNTQKIGRIIGVSAFAAYVIGVIVWRRKKDIQR